MAVRQQVCAILSKNAKVRRRAGTEFFWEAALPAIYALSMLGQLWAKSAIALPAIRHYSPRLAAPPLPRLSCATPRFLFAPDTPNASHAVHFALGLLNASSSCARGYASYADLRSDFLSDPRLRAAVEAAITVEERRGGLASYTIYADGPVAVGDAGSLAPLWHQVHDEGRPTAWESSGVLALQWALDRGVASAHAPRLAEAMLEQGGRSLYTQRLPTAPFKSNFNPNATAARYILSVYLVMGILFSFSMMVNTIVSEKEQRLFEGLQVMGLSEFASFLGWWLFYVPFHSVSALVVTVITAFTGFLASTNLLLLWITLELFVVAFVAYAMLFVSFFSVAKNASACAFLTILGSVAAAIVLALNDFQPAPLCWLLCVVSPLVAAPVASFQLFLAEFDGEGLSFSNLDSSPMPLWGLWLVLLADVLLYFAAAKYTALVTSGRRRWHFLFFPSTWSPPPLRTAALDSPQSSLSEARHLRPPDELPAERHAAPVVSAVGLAKTFVGEGGAEVVALSDVSLEMYEDQITALLGQNGAGKSTAINILTGAVVPSAGKAHVYGFSVSSAIESIRARLGVCPQHDLLYANITCAEHLALLGAIKGLPAAQVGAEAAQLLQMVGLHGKEANRSATLSGGQKRKLSVAMALIGRPRLVVLDEPTAGMDPHSRRAVWDLLADVKRGRAVLLTTHFMDEADALADRITIVSHGTVCATGTPLELKAQYGSGYHLSVALSATEEIDAAAPLLGLVRQFVRGAVLEASQKHQISIGIPQDELPAFGDLFEALDAHKSRLGVAGYGVSLPSLQEVFLSILDEGRAAAAYDANAPPPAAAAAAPPAAGVAHQLLVSLQKSWWAMRAERTGALTALVSWSLAALAFAVPKLIDASRRAAATDFSLDPSRFGPAGYPLYFTASLGLGGELRANSSLQRQYAFRPVPIGGVSEIYALPLDAGAYAAFTGGGGGSAATLFHNASYANALPAFLHLFDQALLDEAAPGLGLRLTSFLSQLPTLATATAVSSATTSTAIVAPILTLFSMVLLNLASIKECATERVERCMHQLLLMGMDVRVYILGFFVVHAALLLTLPLVGVIAAAATGTIPPAALPAYFLATALSLPSILLWNVLLTSFFKTVEGAEGSVNAITLLITIVPTILGQAIASAQAAFFIKVLFLVIPINQFVNVLSSILSIYYTSLYNPSRPIDAATYFSVTFDPLEGVEYAEKGFSLVVGPGMCMLYSAVSIPLFLLLIYVRDVRSYTSPRRVEKPAASSSAHQTLADDAARPPIDWPSVFCCWRGRLFPKAWLSDECCSSDNLSEEEHRQRCKKHWRSSAYIGLAVWLIWFTIATLALPFTGCPRVELAVDPEEGREITLRAEEDADVAAERARVESEPSSTDRVRTVQLRKVFRKNGKDFVAVDGLSLGVAAGTCFSLLGPNGAGKTTAMNMLTGEVTPTSGDATLCGLSVCTSLMEIFKQTGFCPQFKGLFMKMTLRQHLLIYLGLKGLRGPALLQRVREVEEGYGLQEHASKRVRELSGGNRRKLSAAIALSCGLPKVSFLDEPTTGVDVGTRRFIWDRIREGTQYAVVLLTTHYMDEADALAQRIGIMVKGKLQVIGSPQHLKNTHGGGYRVELKGPSSMSEQMTELVQSNFAAVKQLEAHGGYQSYEVAQGFDMAKVFRALERAKAELGLETYTLSQTSLEQVFLNIAEKQNAEDERGA